MWLLAALQASVLGSSAACANRFMRYTKMYMSPAGLQLLGVTDVPAGTYNATVGYDLAKALQRGVRLPVDAVRLPAPLPAHWGLIPQADNEAGYILHLGVPPAAVPDEVYRSCTADLSASPTISNTTQYNGRDGALFARNLTDAQWADPATVPTLSSLMYPNATGSTAGYTATLMVNAKILGQVVPRAHQPGWPTGGGRGRPRAPTWPCTSSAPRGARPVRVSWR